MKKIKILIVEDEVIQAMDLELLLRSWDYTTCGPAVTGEEAICKVSEEKPDVIMMDINIQGAMNGIETADVIISRFSLPVIFLTGYDDEDIHKKALSVNPAGFFVKPFDLDKLRTTIDSLMA